MGEYTKLNRSIYSIKSKPWNIGLSIHVYNPFLELANLPIDLKASSLWLPEFPGIATFTLINIGSIYLFVPKRALVLENLEADQILNTIFPIFAFEDDFMHFDNTIVYILNGKLLTLLTPIVSLKPEDLLSLNFLHTWYSSDINIEVASNVCEYISKRRKKQTLIDTNPHQRFIKVLTEVWLSHLGNFTMTFVIHHFAFYFRLTKVSVDVCKQFLGQEGNNYEPNAMFAPSFSFRNLLANSYETGYSSIYKPDSDLRFVSCGPSVYSKLAFRELVVVFDYYVWLCIFTFFVIIIAISRQVGNNLDMVYLLVKVVFEQGNPISNKLLRQNFSALLGVVIMLIGTVLTNAYKNNNVYNLILPRALVSRQLYQEVFAEGFQLYGRTLAYKANDILFTSQKEEFAEFYKSEHPNTTESEISFQYRKVLHLDFGNNCGGNCRSWSELSDYVRLTEITKEATDIYNKIIVLPEIGNIFYDALNSLESRNTRVVMMENQNEYLIRCLRKCNKVAVLLPFNEAVHVVRQELRSGTRIFDIGMESVFRNEIFIFLTRMWPTYVLRRQSHLKGESGIIDRWTNLLNQTLSNSDLANMHSIKPKSAKMSGNILVIFSVYMVGIGVSLITYILRLVIKHFGIVKILYVRFKQAVATACIGVTKKIESLKKYAKCSVVCTLLVSTHFTRTE